MAAKKPNVLIIWGDDIGISNLSCYSDGLMGYKTPEVSFVSWFLFATDNDLSCRLLRGRGKSTIVPGGAARRGDDEALQQSADVFHA